MTLEDQLEQLRQEYKQTKTHADREVIRVRGQTLKNAIHLRDKKIAVGDR